ncbi:MAG: hypothetical protein KDD82_09660 [Planctomycetes bacterium]|nr:hypothetical protein [Planctomycetota bacterium]
MKSREEIEALLLDVLPALPAELLADGEALREHLGVFPSTGELVDELAATLCLLHEHAPEAPELSGDFADRVMAALPPAATELPRGVAGGGSFPAGPWVLRCAAAAACFALGIGFARWHGTPPVEPAPQRANAEADAPRQAPRDATDLAPAPERPAAPPPRAAQRDPWGALAETPRAQPPLSYVGDRGLGEYASQAQEVLLSLDRLDVQSDPRALRELMLTVHANRLVSRGEALLAELEGDPQHPEQLERLIHGTQVVLRRVRNARGPAAVTVVSALRDEVRTTGLLDAYETLLAPASAPDPDPSPPIESTGPL